MNQLISLEPPDGDFAAYINNIVGPPPEDPETAAREISEQLALRSKDNIEIMNAISPSHNQAGRDSSDSRFVQRGPLSTGGALAARTQQALSVGANGQLEGLPDLAASLQSAAQHGRSTLRQLLKTLSRFVIFGGVAWATISIAFSDQFPGLSPAPGMMAIFVGIVLNNAASKK
ncbi:MAG: hypothetical protein ACRBC3_02635 [Burkholderiaceae bacterium]